MAVMKFSVAQDAVNHAATITKAWQTDVQEPTDKEVLDYWARIQDMLNPVNVPEHYYIVDETGSIGETDDNGISIRWIVTPAEQILSRICAHCGQPIQMDWKFCRQCGFEI